MPNPGAAGQHNFSGEDAPAVEELSNMYPPGEPGLNAHMPQDPRRAKGRPNPDDHIESGMDEGHPAFGRGSGNR